MNDLHKSDIKSFLDAIDHRMPRKDSLSGIFDQLSSKPQREDALLTPKSSPALTSTKKVDANIKG